MSATELTAAQRARLYYRTRSLCPTCRDARTITRVAGRPLVDGRRSPEDLR